MIELSCDIEGDKELSRRFIKIPQDIGSFHEPLFKIGNEVRMSVDANYSSRGSLFGAPWAARKDSKSHPILEDTGRMRSSFQQNLGSDYVEIFNPTPYFKYHQSNKPRKKLPRCIMLKLDQIRKVFIVKTFQAHIGRAVQNGK